jgi:hypothetical protein
MDPARKVLVDITTEISRSLATDPPATAYYKAQLLGDVTQLLRKLPAASTLPQAELSQLTAMRNELAHGVSLATSSDLAPWKRIFTRISDAIANVPATDASSSAVVMPAATAAVSRPVE